MNVQDIKLLKVKFHSFITAPFNLIKNYVTRKLRYEYEYQIDKHEIKTIHPSFTFLT